MPRVVSRAAYQYWWFGIVLGAFALAGLGWGWTSWHRDASFLEQGASAYAKRDFRRAADLARRRVKEAPEDVEA